MENSQYLLKEELATRGLCSLFPNSLAQESRQLLTNRGLAGRFEELERIVFVFIRFEYGARLFHFLMKENVGELQDGIRCGIDRRIANCAGELLSLLKGRQPSPLGFVLPSFGFYTEGKPRAFPKRLAFSCLDGSMEQAFLAILSKLQSGEAYHHKLHTMPTAFYPDLLDELEEIIHEPRARGRHARTLGVNFRYHLYAKLAGLLTSRRHLYRSMEKLLFSFESFRLELVERAYHPQDFEYIEKNLQVREETRPLFLPNPGDKDEQTSYEDSLKTGTRKGRKIDDSQLRFALVEFSPFEHILAEG